MTRPTTGVVKTLTDLEWDMTSPTTWSYKGVNQTKEALFEMVAGSLESKLWTEAASHRLGSRMEHGEPMLKPAVKTQQPDEEGRRGRQGNSGDESSNRRHSDTRKTQCDVPGT